MSSTSFQGTCLSGALAFAPSVSGVGRSHEEQLTGDKHQNPSLRCVARCGGVPRASGAVYEDMRSKLQGYLYRLVEEVVLHTVHEHRWIWFNGRVLGLRYPGCDACPRPERDDIVQRLDVDCFRQPLLCYIRSTMLEFSKKEGVLQGKAILGKLKREKLVNDLFVLLRRSGKSQSSFDTFVFRLGGRYYIFEDNCSFWMSEEAQTLMTGFPNWDVMRVWSETTGYLEVYRIFWGFHPPNSVAKLLPSVINRVELVHSKAGHAQAPLRANVRFGTSAEPAEINPRSKPRTSEYNLR
ncbi:hypothetical protein B0H17DRAFT_1136517 [Mycena rosella]|uniref:Uncharacterized protein n=1 Tax=Mycena rosella TaxID=1033263 RepID=A0AAD7GBQ6_MYCRO|nr:hypothetical protein B0H17DRAFT_1136517 [Mycena rosella]